MTTIITTSLKLQIRNKVIQYSIVVQLRRFPRHPCGFLRSGTLVCHPYGHHNIYFVTTWWQNVGPSIERVLYSYFEKRPILFILLILIIIWMTDHVLLTN